MRYSVAFCFILCLSVAAMIEVNNSIQRFRRLFYQVAGDTIEHANATRFLIAEQCLEICVRYQACDTAAFFNGIKKKCILYSASYITSGSVPKHWEIFRKVNHLYASLISLMNQHLAAKFYM